MVFVFLKSLVEYTHTLNAVLCFFLCLEFKTHFNLLKLLSFICELVWDCWILVITIKD